MCLVIHSFKAVSLLPVVKLGFRPYIRPPSWLPARLPARIATLTPTNQPAHTCIYFASCDSSCPATAVFSWLQSSGWAVVRAAAIAAALQANADGGRRGSLLPDCTLLSGRGTCMPAMPSTCALELRHNIELIGCISLRLRVPLVDLSNLSFFWCASLFIA